MAKEIVVPLKPVAPVTPVTLNTDQLILAMGKNITPEQAAFIKAMKPEDLVKQALAGKSMKEYGKNYDGARTDAIHELIKVSGKTWFDIYDKHRSLHGLNPVKRS